MKITSVSKAVESGVSLIRRLKKNNSNKMSIITTDNEEAAYIFNEIIANEQRNRCLNQHIRSCLTKTNNNSTIIQK